MIDGRGGAGRWSTRRFSRWLRNNWICVRTVFRRGSINDEEFRWLRMFADQAASAIANARAFSELERLRQQLESDNAYLKEEVESALAFGSIVGRSRALQRVLKQVEDVAGQTPPC